MLTINIISERTDVDLLEQLLHKINSGFKITISRTAASIIHALHSELPDIIFCDWDVESINASSFCKNIHADAHFKNVHFIALLADVKDMHHAYASGADEVHMFETNKISYYKLISTTSLISKLKALNVQNQTLTSKVQELENLRDDYISVIQKVIQSRIPSVATVTEFMQKSVLWIAEQFAQEEHVTISKDALTIATKFFAIGKMYLPDGDLNTPVSFEGSPSNQIVANVPSQADVILQNVESLETVRIILRSLYENYDGTGFPDRKQHWQIPLGSRILRVVLDFIEYKQVHRTSSEEALNQIKKFVRHVYDHRIVALLEEYVTTVAYGQSTGSRLKAVQLHDLHDGMKLGRDVITNSGLKLVPAGTVLHEHLIDRIVSHNTMDPVLGNIYIIN